MWDRIGIGAQQARYPLMPFSIIVQNLTSQCVGQVGWDYNFGYIKKA